MKKIIVLAISVAALFCACNKETVIDTPAQQGKTVLTIAFPETKTILGDKDSEGGRQTYWADGDIVNVNGENSNSLSNVPANCTSTSFTFGVINSPYRAVYPNTIWKSNSQVLLPKTAVNSILPLGGISTDSDLVLNALTSALKIQLKKKTDADNIALIEVSSDTQQLSGLFDIAFVPSSLTSASTDDADKVVRIVGNWPLSNEPTEFIIPVPAGTYGITVKIRDTQGHYMVQSTTSAKTFTKGQIKSLSPIEFDPDKTELVITTPAEWNSFANAYNSGTKPAEVALGNDITFDNDTNTAFKSITSFTSTLDGNGYSISGLSVTAPLFTAIASGGVVKNLSVDGSFTFAVSGSSTQNFGAIASTLQGNISEVTVSASINVNDGQASVLTEIGGLVGRANAARASFDNCQFNGSITIPVGFSTSAQLRVGGIVAAITEKNPAVSISNSSFCGTIKCLGCTTSTGNPHLKIGGIIGDNAGGVISNCTTIDAAESVKPSVTINQTEYKSSIVVSNTGIGVAIGGIAGYSVIGGSSLGAITSCSNASTILGVVSDPEGENSSNNLYSGGIVGYNTSTISSSSNSADLQYYAATRTQYIGGIAGYSTVGIDGGSSKTINNTGNVTVAPSVLTSNYMGVGGVVGCSTANISNTINSGVVSFTGIYSNGTEGTGSTKYACVGGILGLSTNSITISNCVNEGSVKYQKTSDSQTNACPSYLGGIAGRIAAGGSIISNCTNSAGVKNNNYDNKTTAAGGTMTGGIVGALIGTSTNRCSIVSSKKTNTTNDDNHRCYAERGYVGGIAGYVNYVDIGSDNESDSCSCESRLYGITKSWIGGLVGYLNNSTIKKSKYNGTIANTKQSPGGVAYRMEGISTIDNCTFSGTLPSTAAGLILFETNGDDGTFSISNCKIGGTYNGTSVTQSDITNQKKIFAGWTTEHSISITNCTLLQ